MGGNDYHLKQDGSLHPTLGRDEPSDERKAGIRSAGAARLQKLKDELTAAGAELTERERKLIERQQKQLEKDRELELRERALEKREKKAGIKPKAPTPAGEEDEGDDEDLGPGGTGDSDKGE